MEARKAALPMEPLIPMTAVAMQMASSDNLPRERSSRKKSTRAAPTTSPRIKRLRRSKRSTIAPARGDIKISAAVQEIETAANLETDPVC